MLEKTPPKYSKGWFATHETPDSIDKREKVKEMAEQISKKTLSNSLLENYQLLFF
jgi:hypothetical protein